LRNDTEAEAVEEELPESVMIGSTAAIVEIYKKVALVSPTDATVVIEGETGTGKELVARIDPQLQPARQAALCRWIAPPSRHRSWKASFSAPYAARSPAPTAIASACFEAANRGTVFLDEIGEIDKSFSGQPAALPPGT